MNTSTKLSATLSATLLTAGLTSANAMAQVTENTLQKHEGVYVGGNYGYLKVDGQDDFDDDNDVWQGLVGYRFNRYIAIEGSYIDFGDYGSSLANADTDGYTAAIKGMLPISENFALFVKGGQLWWESDYAINEFGGSFDDESLFIGAGVNYAITRNLSVNAEYTIYDADLDADEFSENIDDADFDTDLKQASLGIEYRF
ncbi:porin family protein [Salinimonas sp. HHU 13199]|uniref:Porin family protein n=1 Tax=Salinimonas profundi TaxID=2729140 RepID=A0ABR8LMK3_9ALTE|nr:porin family protein [Salinimonas profundi]MBD3586281.1 porin family protein [Salinimonas profundi]